MHKSMPFYIEESEDLMKLFVSILSDDSSGGAVRGGRSASDVTADAGDVRVALAS